jgi:phosphoribosylamine--glycine ligase
MLPGNPGMRHLGDTIEGIEPTDVGAVAAMARSQRIDLAVIGPEAPLAAGVADALTRADIPTFGPSRSAAKLEASKAFAKEVMHRAGVPTADAQVFEDIESAHSHLDRTPGPYVVKADGLAAGKGVIVTDSAGEARSWVTRCLTGGFGEAGQRVVVEEYLDGPELSVFAVCDGSRYLLLDPARDYKRLLDGDDGPNTGGMGSYSPVALRADILTVTERQIIEPTLAVMTDLEMPYVGFLYVGLALTAAGPKVIEFNCRLGDPETQVVLPRLESDLLEVLAAAAGRDLADHQLRWHDTAAVNVVLASAGYPDSPRSGDVITGLEHPDDDVLIFHAGTARQGGRTVTAGGRVLSVVGTGADLAAARQSAYNAIEGIRFRGMQYRSDIAAD